MGIIVNKGEDSSINQMNDIVFRNNSIREGDWMVQTLTRFKGDHKEESITNGGDMNFGIGEWFSYLFSITRSREAMLEKYDAE